MAFSLDVADNCISRGCIRVYVSREVGLKKEVTMSNKQFVVSLVVLIPSGFYVVLAPFNPLVVFPLGAVALVIGLWALWAYKKTREASAKSGVN